MTANIKMRSCCQISPRAAIYLTFCCIRCNRDTVNNLFVSSFRQRERNGICTRTLKGCKLRNRNFQRSRCRIVQFNFNPAVSSVFSISILTYSIRHGFRRIFHRSCRHDRSVAFDRCRIIIVVAYFICEGGIRGARQPPHPLCRLQESPESARSVRHARRQSDRRE